MSMTPDEMTETLRELAVKSVEAAANLNRIAAGSTDPEMFASLMDPSRDVMAIAAALNRLAAEDVVIEEGAPASVPKPMPRPFTPPAPSRPIDTTWDAVVEASKVHVPSMPVEDDAEDVDWDRMIDIAVGIMKKRAGHVWTAKELLEKARQIYDGPDPRSWRGVPMILIKKLRRHGVVEKLALRFSKFRLATDWDAVAQAADRVLSKDPDRVWRSNDLVRKIWAKDSSFDLVSVQREIVPTLEGRGVLEQVDGGVRKARKARPTSGETDIDWDSLVCNALDLLIGNPDRSWRAAELTKLAAQDLNIQSLQGVHFGVVSRLRNLGAIVSLDATPFGTFKASSDISSSPEALDGDDKESVESLSDIVEAIDKGIEKFSDMTDNQRTAAVATWAGRLRALRQRAMLQEEGEMLSLQQVTLQLLERLGRIADRAKCGWINAFSLGWTLEDWSVYVEFHRSIVEGREHRLNTEQRRMIHRARLRGLHLSGRTVTQISAQMIILDSLDVLATDDVEVKRAMGRFGRPTREKGTKNKTVIRRNNPKQLIDDDVLAATRDQYVLMAGGQGARDDQRRAIRHAFGFDELEWEMSERRGGRNAYQSAAKRVEQGTYDLVILLTRFLPAGVTSMLTDACKKSKTDVLYVPRGYSVNSIEQAFREQLLAPEEATN